MSTKEGAVKKDIRKWLEFQGFIKMGGELPDAMSESSQFLGEPPRFLGTFYMPVPHPFQTAGIGDFILCVRPNGHTLWIEAKAEDGELSGPQEMRHEEIRRSDGTVWVVNSLDALICQAVESQLFDVLPYHDRSKK